MPLAVIPFPNFDPILISIGPLAVRWYALAYIVGILTGWLYARIVIRNERYWGGPAPMSIVDFDDFILWVTLGIILGGRTGYVLFYNFEYFAQHPAEILQLWNGGMSFHGGLLGCLFALVLFARHRGLPVLSVGDVSCAAAPIGLGLGRIANFINGELWGRPTDVPWAMVFPNGGPIPRHPSQLYEAALEGVVLFVLLAVLVRCGALKRPGTIVGVFCIGYALSRMVCELFREPDVQLGFLWGGLTMGMLLSVPLLLAGIVFLVVARRRPGASAYRMSDGQFSMEAEVRRRIAVAGPMPVAQYMALCLTDPAHGYYMTRDPLGAAGDFVTSPEISQMFGELLGLWAAAVWRQIGAPEYVRLVELGPGRGTMMLDALRAVRVVPEFRRAVVVHFVEVSPALQKLQRQAFAGHDVAVQWHSSFDDVPPGPAIVLANEFFDALPVHQAVNCVDGWHERVIKIDENDDLRFSISRDPIPLFEQLLPKGLREPQIGEIFEWRADQIALELGRRVVRDNAAVLIIDYGHVAGATGDTLQAVGSHDFVDPLVAPGHVDLTAHVDFQALAQAAESMGARAHGPIEQGDLLRHLGIDARAASLRSAAPITRIGEIDTAHQRLTSADSTGMGRLFKALALSHPKCGPLPGF